MRYTFKSHERLKRDQHIETLFRQGKAFSISPIRFIYHLVPHRHGDAPVQVGFSVPKRKFRHSVERHRIARLMREAWRLNKHLLYDTMVPAGQLHLFMVFTNTEMPTYETIVQAVLKGIARLQQVLDSKTAP